jgi:hypothetical protein
MVFAIWIAQALSALVAEWTEYVSRSHWARSLYAPLIILGLVALPLSNGLMNFTRMDLSRDTQALDYGQQVFATVPDHAAVVAYGDDHTLALWYYRFVERPESHMLVIAPGLLSYAWYRDQLERHNPGWLWPPATTTQWDLFLRMLVEKNQVSHAFFWTEPDSLFQPAYQFAPVGSLFRLGAVTSP